MSEQNSENSDALDLTAALRILRNAGIEDPRMLSEDPDARTQFIINALCDLSVHDGLTGLVNATFFHAVLEREIHRSLRTGRTCALMVIDIDHFKHINDTYGHAEGDRVLQAVADQLRANLRNMDTAARIGGEEFAVILPECSPEDAVQAAKRIHSSLNPLTTKTDQHTIRLTTSVGLVWTDPSIPAKSSSLLSEADQEMYRAKRNGRGRLCYKHADPTIVSRRERSALMTMEVEDGPHGH